MILVFYMVVWIFRCRSLGWHQKHLVLQHFEATALSCPRKHPEGFLVINQLFTPCPLVCRRELGAGISVVLASIWYVKIMAFPKSRPIACKSVNQTITLLSDELLHHIEWEQEWSTARMRQLSTIGVPGVGGVATDDLLELCADKGQSGSLVVTLLVKCLCFESMFGGFEYPLDLAGMA